MSPSLSRRRFLEATAGSIAAAGASADAAYAQRRRGTPRSLKKPSGVVSAPGTVPNKTLINQSRLTYRGSFMGFGNGDQGFGFSSRRVGGVFKLFEWVKNGDPLNLYEYTPPSLASLSTSNAYGAAPSPVGATNYGVITGTPNKWESILPENQGWLRAMFCHYDETRDIMIWGGATYYDGSYIAEPVVGYSLGPNFSVAQGFWSLSPTLTNGGYGNRWATNMGRLPQWLADGFCGGRRFHIGGGGGYFVGIHGNNTTMAPTLFAMGDLAGTEAWKAVATSANIKPLLFNPTYNFTPYPVYPQATGDGYLHVPRIGRRPAVMGALNKYANLSNSLNQDSNVNPDDPWLPDATAPNGYQSFNGDCNPAGVFVETSTKFGYLAFLNLIEGSWERTITACTFVGTVAGRDYWDLTLDSAAGLVTNWSAYVHDPVGSIHYGGWQVRIQDPAGYAPNLPGGFTTSAIVGNRVRISNYEKPRDEDIPIYGPVFNIANCVGRKFTGGVFYGGGGGKSSARKPVMSVYHPGDIAVQAQNLTGPWSELDPRDAWEITEFQQRRGYPYTPDNPVVGVAGEFDPVSRLLYLKAHAGDEGPSFNANLHMIYVYEVAD